MDFVFTPEKETGPETPYLEDARADFAPYYSSKKSLGAAKSEIAVELGKLNAFLIGLTPGYFTIQGKLRYGFEIRFMYLDKEGLIRVAGLPIRNPTPTKIETSRIQALLNVRDWLKSLLTQAIFTAGASPLLPYLLVRPNQTIADYITATGKLLPAGPDVYQGEIING